MKFFSFFSVLFVLFVLFLDWHRTPHPDNKVKSVLVLDVIVRQGMAIQKLFTSKDDPLMVYGNTNSVQYHQFQGFDCVRRSHLKGVSSPHQRFQEYPHFHECVFERMELKSTNTIFVIAGGEIQL